MVPRAGNDAAGQQHCAAPGWAVGQVGIPLERRFGVGLDGASTWQVTLMTNADDNLDRKPQIKRVESAQLTGPIPIGPNPYGATAYFTFSAIAVCDWLTSSNRWVRALLTIPKSGGYAFPHQSVKHVHMHAWPCAVTGYAAEDAGWAVDTWAAKISGDGEHDYVDVVLAVGARGAGARFNRIGYTWTAYVADPGEVGTQTIGEP